MHIINFHCTIDVHSYKFCAYLDINKHFISVAPSTVLDEGLAVAMNAPFSLTACTNKVCLKECKYGLKQDENGCDICECKG